MSDYRFFSYADFDNYNETEYILDLPFGPFSAKLKNKVSEELTTELNVPYTIFEILVAIVAIIGNLMVIIVFQRDKKLRRRTNYYIVSLAIADFLVGLLGVPFAILASVGLPTNLHACLFTVSLLVVLCTISIFCLVAVSIDRYWAILYPMAYSRNVRTKTAIGIISMCWLAGSVVGFLPLFGWHADVGHDQACLFVEVMDYNYLVFLYFATIITPAILLLAFYAHIYRVIIRQVRQIVTMNPVGESSRRSSMNQPTPHRPHGGTMLRVLGAARKRDVKATQNLSIIVLFFMICWIPLYTINCVKAFCPDCYVHPKLTFFCIILSHLNSAVNPVLYAYHLKDFRAALKNLILKILGVEVEQPPDLHYRISLASQQRLQSMMEKRSSIQNRIYIDSPVWLRQQQRDGLRPSAITCSLSTVHQTVAAVASATADINRDMWKIVEAPSGAEESGKYSMENSLNDSSMGKRQSNHSIKFPNCQNINTSLTELEDDEVFLPCEIKVSNHSVSIKLREKLKSEDDKYDIYNGMLPMSELLNECEETTSSSNLQTNTLVPASSETSIQNYSPLNGNVPHRTDDLPQQNSPIFLIENDTNLLSPEHRPYITKIRRIPSPFGSKATRKIMRSCSCTNDGELISSTSMEKLSPFKMVSNMLFPPVKHSSLFHIFDYYKDTESADYRKRTSSDS